MKKDSFFFEFRLLVTAAMAHAGSTVAATVALLARPGDRILTSDPKDITRLVQAGGIPALVVGC